ncbi:MAG TPA: SDR family oxidoreductase [Candidatus Saccharimonadales bacterium]|nr:SDR family oxidoreductase [Candidatus Saccharimonadales bacterium]
MKILLTGSKGNLGQALIRQGKNHRFVGIDRGDWDELARSMRGVQAVIHAASDLVTPPRQDPRGVIDSNLMTSLHLLDQLVKRPTIRFVFISSCAVYGQSAVTHEEVAPAPISINGITKLLNEELIREFCQDRGIEFQIFRVFNTFGGQDRFSIISHLRRSVEEKRPFKMFNGGVSQRDFVHVDDIAAVLLTLLDRPVKQAILNIGSGETVRVSDVVEAFQKKNPDLEIIRDTRQETEYSRADISKLRKILPKYEFRRVLDFVRDEL